MPYYVHGNRIHTQPRVPRTPPTPMYSDDDDYSSGDSRAYDDYRDRDYRDERYRQSWERNQQPHRDSYRDTYGANDNDTESDRESSEPTVSGFEPSYEQIDRQSKAIVANDQEQLLAFKTIQAIHPVALEPYGFLPNTTNPRTGHFDWLRRTPKGIIAMVWCRINSTASDVVFEVTLHTKEVLEVHVPLDSWRRKTCDPEAVKAAIQQAYLNVLRGQDSAVIVKPGMRSLKFITQREYEDMCHSSSSGSSSRLSRLSRFGHQRSQSQRVSYQVPVGHDRRQPVRLSSPPPSRPHHQQTRPVPNSAPIIPPRPQHQHQPQPHHSRSLSQPPPQAQYRHRTQSQSLPAHQVQSRPVNPVHHAQPIQVFSSPVAAPVPSPSHHHTAHTHPHPHPNPPQPRHQANYKNTGAQPPVFPSRTSRTSGYY